MLVRRSFIVGIFFLLGGCLLGDAVDGELKVWHKVTLSFDGPQTSEQAAPNPFTDFRLDVTFTGPSGQTYAVPGYFAADGDAADTGADSGNQWHAHLAPDEAGRWSYGVSFRTGSNIAVSDDTTAGEAVAFDGKGGSFMVGPADTNAPGFLSKGMLRYVGEHYLQFAESGESFIKGGAGSPENFLAYEDFDGTWDDGGTHYPALGENQLHGYGPHAADHRSGDPSWKGGKGTGIIGAINYIADKGLNAVYIIPMNVKGDGQDVWPWTGPDERTVFDVSKLAQWEIVFDHMDRRGIMKDILLTETENESLFEALDGGEFAVTRKLYYREMIARFAHHLALSWNLGEENGHDGTGEDPYKKPNTDRQRQAFCEYLRRIDPYDHHIAVHNWPGDEERLLGPLLGNANFEGVSLQEDQDYFQEVSRWVNRSAAAGRKWVVAIDEPLGWEFGLRPDVQDPDHDAARKEVLWPSLFAGGAGVSWYFGWQNNAPTSDLSNEDWRSREAMWAPTRVALDFFKRHLPFARMKAANKLTAAPDSLVLARANRVYAVYMKTAGDTKLSLPKGEYALRWYNPRTGGDLQTGSIKTLTGGQSVSLGHPPKEADKDWVALVKVVNETSS
ncbi:MAG: DUF5060 domain-containing protein [Anaerohalosphaeraceae bacterium]